jgi:hypothetical protein
LRTKRIRLFTVAFYKAPPPPQTAVNRRLHSKSLAGAWLIVATNRAVELAVRDRSRGRHRL